MILQLAEATFCSIMRFQVIHWKENLCDILYVHQLDTHVKEFLEYCVLYSLCIRLPNQFEVAVELLQLVRVEFVKIDDCTWKLVC